MKISVAIAAYEMHGRGAEFLTNCLESVICQKNVDFETIVSDHSEDDILKKVCANDFPSVKYVKNNRSRGSSSANFNNAIDIASGDLIKILCQDDFLFDSSSLETTVETFKNTGGTWLVSAYYHTLDKKSVYNLHIPELNDSLLFINTIGTHSCLTIKRDIVDRFDENLIWFMDCEYFHRLRVTHGDPVILKQPTAVQMLWLGQVTNTLADNNVRMQERKYLMTKYGV